MERLAAASFPSADQAQSKAQSIEAEKVTWLHERVQVQVSQCVAAIEQRDAAAREQRDWMHAVVESVEAVSIRLSRLEEQAPRCFEPGRMIDLRHDVISSPRR